MFRTQLRFSEFVQAHQDTGINNDQIEQFGARLSQGHSLADLLLHYYDEFSALPAEQLRRLAALYRQYEQWGQRCLRLQQARLRAGDVALDDDVLRLSPKIESLDALFRAAKMLSNSDPTTYHAALEAAQQIFSRCWSVVLSHGQIVCNIIDLSHPEAGIYDAYAKKRIAPADLASHQWLAIRRGQREKLLHVDLTYDASTLTEQVALFSLGLSPALAAPRSEASILEELVLNDLKTTLWQFLDDKAQRDAIAAAQQSLSGLLQAAPLKTNQLAAVFLQRSGQPVTAVIVDGEGDLLVEKTAEKTVTAQGNWIETIVSFLITQEQKQVVLPTGGGAPQLVNQLEEKLRSNGIQVLRIRAAALSEARQVLIDPPLRLNPSVASAVVLARRALNPLHEWSLVDPVNIGVAEYQHDLDETQLRSALRETVDLCLAQRRRGKTKHQPTTEGWSGHSPSRPRPTLPGTGLNPLVKSLHDLRPGMACQGVVSNISQFGAFIHIGLPEEGLAHISELSTDFVSDPNQVVRIGQQVTAYVLSVDSQRRRIALSLKTPNKKPHAHSAQRTPRNKVDALASLERLFKK